MKQPARVLMIGFLLSVAWILCEKSSKGTLSSPHLASIQDRSPATEGSVLVYECAFSWIRIWTFDQKLDTLGNATTFKGAGGWDCSLTKQGRLFVANWDATEHRTWAGTLITSQNHCSFVRYCVELTNGHFFVATTSSLEEFDAARKCIRQTTLRGALVDAAVLPNDNILYVKQGGAIIESTKSGKIVRRIAGIPLISGSLCVLASGNYLVTSQEMNKVVEIHPTGRVISSVNASMPSSAVRLQDGSTLIGSRFGKYLMRVAKNGSLLWSRTTEGEVRRIRTSRKKR